MKKIHVPIGMDIGGETFEEIALSIMAEIVKTLKGGSGRSISEFKGVYVKGREEEIPRPILPSQKSS